MFKIVVALALLFTIARAGFLGAPLALHAPVVAAPIAVKTAVPVATSYQNTFHISAAPVPVVVKAAPVIAAPAIHYAPAPAIVKAPLLAHSLAYSYH